MELASHDLLTVPTTSLHARRPKTPQHPVCYIPRPDKTRINFTLSYSDPDSEAMYYYTAYVLDLESRL